jgi:uncharacterized membrane protein YcaP (DUF421 family)
VWRRFIEGLPTVLVRDGKYLDPALRKEELERSQVEMAMREHGIDDVRTVKLAVLEIDGSSAFFLATPR